MNGFFKRFSLECRNSYTLALVLQYTSLHDWLKKLALICHPIKEKLKVMLPRSHTLSLDLIRSLELSVSL